MHLYQTYNTAMKEGEESEEAQQLRQDKEKHQALLISLSQ
jgi:hypothetical protein